MGVSSLSKRATSRCWLVATLLALLLLLALALVWLRAAGAEHLLGDYDADHIAHG